LNNETALPKYFQARRAYTNATYEYAIAHAHTLARISVLVSALQVRRKGLPTAQELSRDRFEVDADSQYPAEAPYVANFGVTQTRLCLIGHLETPLAHSNKYSVCERTSHYGRR